MAKASAVATAPVVEESEFDTKVAKVKDSAPAIPDAVKKWALDTMKVTGYRGLGKALVELSR